MIEKIKSDELNLSIECFPPKREGILETVIKPLKEFKKLNPDYISITYGANGSGSDKTADVASIAKDAFDIEVLAHMTAVNMSIEKLENLLETYDRKGISNLLVLRGDLVPDSKFIDFKHANELMYYIKKNHPNFTLLGACHPEKHPESKSFEEDIDTIKRKIDCGAEAFTTQLALDNKFFFEFRDRVEKKGIKAPIVYGVMPMLSLKSVERNVKMNGTYIPKEFQRIIDRGNENFYEEGIEYAINQIKELIANGITNIHIYAMNKPDVAKRIFSEIRK